ncbi:uncharacterized protein LOC124344168 isoform X2 [Daphnia pulicaria]|uniref:uncharacterized protein LOC124344168 isoform X2 n=1 Tax=Daphnia pulicaria TaxID=35523 RepID=UPI001EEABB1D|nr:uncharacterized protein LOC124344168 isoform X2 [Daphnia pulicaria]
MTGIFPTVEKRWHKEHPNFSSHNLPNGQELLDPLLNELGILNPTTFQFTRDSCQKNLQAPLFWVPYDSNSQLFWPVVVVECQHNRLLCGVPYLDQQLHPFANQQSMSVVRSCDVVIVLELLSKLVHVIQLPLVKMSDQLNRTIQQWLPFGRASGQQQLELLNKSATTQKSWLRSKPKIEVQVKEEVRMVASNLSVRAEVYGTIYFIIEQDVDCCHSIRLELGFSKLPGIPSALFHSSALVHWEKNNCTINIQQLLEKTFPLCYYNFSLEVPPIQPILKIRMGELGKVSIFVQLHISATMRNTLNRLEIRLSMPSGNRIARILTVISPGLVSVIKDGSQLLWNLTPMVSSSNAKLKEDLTLNVDVVMERLDASLANTQANIAFTSTSSVSGAYLSLLQPTEFKLVTNSELKSSSYRVWNQEATEFV